MQKPNTPIPILWLRWLGLEGIELRAGKESLHLNPMLSRMGMRSWRYRNIETKKDLLRKYISDCQHVLVSSTAGKHIGDVPALLRTFNAQALGSQEVCEALNAQCVPAEQCNQQKNLQHGYFQIEILPAKTGPDGFLICFNKLRLLTPGAGSDANNPKADILFLSPQTGFTFEEKAGAYQELLDAVQPKLVFLTGWDDPKRSVRQSVQPPRVRTIENKTLPNFFNPITFKLDLLSIKPDMQVFIPEIFDSYQVQRLLEMPHVPERKNPLLS